MIKSIYWLAPVIAILVPSYTYSQSYSGRSLTGKVEFAYSGKPVKDARFYSGGAIRTVALPEPVATTTISHPLTAAVPSSSDSVTSGSFIKSFLSVFNGDERNRSEDSLDLALASNTFNHDVEAFSKTISDFLSNTVLSLFRDGLGAKSNYRGDPASFVRAVKSDLSKFIDGFTSILHQAGAPAEVVNRIESSATIAQKGKI